MIIPNDTLSGTIKTGCVRPSVHKVAYLDLYTHRRNSIITVIFEVI